MRLATTLLGSLLVLFTQSSCSDDTNPPSPDKGVVADKAITVDKSIPTADKTAVPDKTVTTGDKSLVIPDAPFFEAGIPTCAYEKNLATVTLPCVCVKTVVYDLAVQYPNCKSPMKVVCCPSKGVPVCE